MKNYFEHFGVPKAFHINLDQIRKNYYKISRSLHPDHHRDQDLDEKINDHNLAYDILCNPLQRLKYIIELEGYSHQIDKPLEASFLMEMMELHEEIDSAVESSAVEKINELKLQLDQYESELLNTYKQPINQYDSGILNESIMLALVDYFVKLKYLRRLRKTLSA